jgi:TonB family protein
VPATTGQTPAKRFVLPVVLVALALVAVMAVVKLTGRHENASQPAATEIASSTQPEPSAGTPSSPAAAHASRHTASSNQPKPTPITQAQPALQAPAKTPTPGAATKSAVAHEVLPNVSQRALGTITGTLKVRVRIKVDRGGNVTQASLESAGPSPYFARLALAAANGWKFTAEPQPSQTEWRLLFEFRRDGTRAIPTQIR